MIRFHKDITIVLIHLYFEVKETTFQNNYNIIYLHHYIDFIQMASHRLK